MTNKELISSGELELYIAGMLSEERAIEISEIIKTDNKVEQEVEAIEEIIMRLAKEATISTNQDFSMVLKKIVTQRISDSENEKLQEEAKPKPSKYIQLRPYIGWAAAAVFLVFLGIQYQKTITVTNNLNANLQQKENLEELIDKQNINLAMKEELLATVISDDTKLIDLNGQDVSPDSKAKLFWNTNENKVVINPGNLPEPPTGKVYQVWSLTLNPLTPTSLGLLDNYNKDNNLFVLENPNESQAFGITLEPEGGSETPTLEQLYVLGTLES